jgi:hypothetical protein
MVARKSGSSGAHAQLTLIMVRHDQVALLDQVLEMFEAILDAELWVILYANHVTATNTW